MKAYATGWPDIKELDEIAKKLENVPTFTSEDKQFLEDLFEEQAAAIAFDNTGTDLQSDNVEDAIKEAATMGGGINYSTNEVNTGLLWIDGNPIYQRVFEFENTLEVGASSWAPTGISIDNIGRIIKADSMYTNYTYYPIMADYYNDEVLLLSCRSNDDTYVKYLVLQYTKTPAQTKKGGKK